MIRVKSNTFFVCKKEGGKNGLIGQKTCYKTAIAIEISMAIAVLSFLKEDRGWTKNVFRMLVNS